MYKTLVNKSLPTSFFEKDIVLYHSKVALIKMMSSIVIHILNRTERFIIR